MRLRTLPLSLAGVVLGAFLAWPVRQTGVLTLIALLLTTVCLQILSNLSNELGDYLSGTDGTGREGPMYSLGEGKITESEFKKLIIYFVGLCCFFGVLMIASAFNGNIFCIKALCLYALGVCAVWAAMHYTLGKNPYGYIGLGDLFVFIFFGLVSVAGAYYVIAQDFTSWHILLPAVCIGMFSVGVLNTNNIRDMESDAGTRKTVPLLIGERKAKIYQTALIVIGWVTMVVFTLLEYSSPWNWLYLITLPLYIVHLYGVWKHHGGALDKYLPLLVMSSFLFSLLAGIGYLL